MFLHEWIALLRELEIVDEYGSFLPDDTNMMHSGGVSIHNFEALRPRKDDELFITNSVNVAGVIQSP